MAQFDQWVLTVLLAATRFAALLSFSPFWQLAGFSPRIKIIFLLAISLLMAAGLSLPSGNLPGDGLALSLALMREFLLGMLLGYSLQAMFAVFSFAGHLLDLQIGFGAAGIYDPLSRRQSPVIASLLGLFALALFFSLNAHHSLLHLVRESYVWVPLGTYELNFSPSQLLLPFAQIFIFGLALAAPVVFCLFLLDLVLAVISRNLPQLNILMLSPPVKIALGLWVWALMVPLFLSSSQNGMARYLHFWGS